MVQKSFRYILQENGAHSKEMDAWHNLFEYGYTMNQVDIFDHYTDVTCLGGRVGDTKALDFYLGGVDSVEQFFSEFDEKAKQLESGLLRQKIDFSDDVIRSVLDIQSLYSGLRADNVSLLSHREQQVLAIYCRGRTASEVAQVLAISRRTAEQHLSNIRMKLGLSSRSGLYDWHFSHNAMLRH